MSVTEVGALHGRYVRAADRFKSIWTFHQFATGVFSNFVHEPLPYRVDFQSVYDRVKRVGSMLNAAQATAAGAAMSAAEEALEFASRTVLLADDRIGPSILRRFFERMKTQDDAIVYNLIKFYLYADAVEGDRRDKLDFLFTRVGEELVPQRGEFVSRDSLEFREKILALVSILRIAEPPRDEVLNLIRAVKSMREDIQSARAFDDLTGRNLLKATRVFKHRIGDLYFHADVLLAIVELNVATKNRFVKLYASEEQRILEDAAKLMEHGQALERNFGDMNPELMEEIARFREFKERFDAQRSESNVKHAVILQLKTSINNILAQLDRGLDVDEMSADDELPAAFFAEAQSAENVVSKFGRSEPLAPFLTRIAAAVDPIAGSSTFDQILETPAVKELRLEPWEIGAYLKMFDRLEREAEEDNEELWRAYLRGGALRVKIDEEATILATTMAAGVKPDADLLRRSKQSLDAAKELDELFGDFLQEAVYYSNPKILHQLYRSRFRLLRGFSGLWLIYDRQA